MAEFDLAKELGGLFRANVALINLVTWEEERVIQVITGLDSKLGVYTWDIADGMKVIREAAHPMPKKELTTDNLLPFLADQAPQNCVVVLKDFHHSWNAKKAMVTRKLRNMSADLRARNQFLVMLTPVRDLPMELKDDVVSLDVPLPGMADLGLIFDQITKSLDRNKLPGVEVRERLVRAALGLTTTQARLAFTQAYTEFGRFDERGIDRVMEAKRQVIRESGALEFFPADGRETDVGGLDLMKAWLRRRECAFGEPARKAKLPYPKGVALIGIPGTGKSLSARMTAGVWKVPLLRLDAGAVFGSLLGESEQNMRRALQVAERVSPCLLWIDEMEKAFAGAGGQQGAGQQGSGAAARVFGTFLTWMQERQAPVYVIATANDISALPVELMGRFDRTFFLDLPNQKEREQILLIHLKIAAIQFPERKFRIPDLVQKSRGYVGREIERAVREARFIAFADENREMKQEDIEKALGEIVPLSKSHEDRIGILRKCLEDGLASPASSPEVAGLGVGRGRVIDVG